MRTEVEEGLYYTLLWYISPSFIEENADVDEPLPDKSCPQSDVNVPPLVQQRQGGREHKLGYEQNGKGHRAAEGARWSLR